MSFNTLTLNKYMYLPQNGLQPIMRCFCIVHGIIDSRKLVNPKGKLKKIIRDTTNLNFRIHTDSMKNVQSTYQLIYCFVDIANSNNWSKVDCTKVWHVFFNNKYWSTDTRI